MPPKYIYQKAENQTIGASFALSLSLSLSLPSPSLPTRSHTGAGHMQIYRRKSRVKQLNAQRSSKSLVCTLSGIVWFLAEFWTGIVFEHDVQSGGVCSKWQGRIRRKHAAPWTFSFMLESERCGCQQRNAVNGKRRKGEEDQTSIAGQYLRKHHSLKRKLYNRFFELSEASAV